MNKDSYTDENQYPDQETLALHVGVGPVSLVFLVPKIPMSKVARSSLYNIHAHSSYRLDSRVRVIGCDCV